MNTVNEGFSFFFLGYFLVYANGFQASRHFDVIALHFILFFFFFSCFVWIQYFSQGCYFGLGEPWYSFFLLFPKAKSTGVVASFNPNRLLCAKWSSVSAHRGRTSFISFFLSFQEFLHFIISWRSSYSSFLVCGCCAVTKLDDKTTSAHSSCRLHSHVEYSF